MGTSVLLGAFLGAACALPLALLQRLAARGTVRLRAGVAVVAGSFFVMQGALMAMWRLAPLGILPFGVAMVLAFLACVVAAVVRWHP